MDAESQTPQRAGLNVALWERWSLSQLGVVSSVVIRREVGKGQMKAHLRVPVVDQWVKDRCCVVSVRMQVPSLASLSGLRIWALPQAAA